MPPPISSSESSSSQRFLNQSDLHPSHAQDEMAIFRSRKEPVDAAPADKTTMEFSEDLEAVRSNSKDNNGRIERVELTPEEVNHLNYRVQ